MTYTVSSGMLNSSIPYNYDPTSIQRPFERLSKVIKVSDVTPAADSQSRWPTGIYLSLSA